MRGFADRPDMIDFSKLSALIVENNLMMRNIISEMLHQFGCRKIAKVADAEEALTATFEKKFDFIILDFFLGSMDGGDFTHLIRRDKSNRNRKIPILLITGQPDHEKVIKARSCGINDMLAKPLSAKSVYERIYVMLTEDRPFIDTEAYVGPSPRGRAMPLTAEMERATGLEPATSSLGS